MGSFGVVVVSPSFDNNLGFPQRVEGFAVQQFVAHSPLKLLRYPFSQSDLGRLGVYRLDPASDGLGNDVWAVI